MQNLGFFGDLFDDFGFAGCNAPALHVKNVYSSPKVDVKEEKDAYILEMELPGFSEKDVNVELNQNVLTISSVKQTEKNENLSNEKTEQNEVKFLLKERNLSDFQRSFTLPEDTDLQKIEAGCKDGILTVKMARKEASRPRKILINNVA